MGCGRRALILSAPVVIVRPRVVLRYPADMTISSRRHARRSVLALLLGGSILISWLTWATTVPPGPLASVDGETWLMSVGGEQFVVEVAATPASRQRGLMGREYLVPGHGMLFLFAEPAPRTFWMRNVQFGLDILYLDADWRIVELVERAPPCQATPCAEYPTPHPVQYVLELPAGSSDRLGLALGARIAPPAGLP